MARVKELQSRFEEHSSQLVAFGRTTDPERRIRSFKTVSDPVERRMLIRWIMRRSFGKPSRCNRCDLALRSEAHVQQCHGIEVDALLRSCQWHAAIDNIRLILSSREGVTAAAVQPTVSVPPSSTRGSRPQKRRWSERGAHASWRVHMRPRLDPP